MENKVMEIELKGFQKCNLHSHDHSLHKFLDGSKEEMFLVKKEGDHLNVWDVMEVEPKKGKK